MIFSLNLTPKQVNLERKNATEIEMFYGLTLHTVQQLEAILGGTF